MFKAGDLVLVERKRKKKGVNPKLETKFEGPFEIREAYGNGTYKVATKGTVNECRLKLFTPCPDAQGQPSIPESVPTSTSQTTVVHGNDLSVAVTPETNPEDNHTQENSSHDSTIVAHPPIVMPDAGRTHRVRKKPAYLQDFVLD